MVQSKFDRLQSEQKDLINEQIITNILEDGTPEKQKNLADFHNLTDAKLELLIYYAKLRKNTIEQKEKEIKIREEGNPIPTEEEINLGCYIEQIEPQVRDAVLNLQRKGYTSYESGFAEFKKQNIGFEKKYFKNFQLLPDLANQLELQGVIIKIDPEYLSFTCNRVLTLEELKQIWNKIESAVPDLHQPAEQNNLPAAESFRNKWKK